MTRYHVDTAGNLESVRAAINDGALGPHASRMVTHVRGGVMWQEPAAAYEARSGIEPEQVVHSSRLVIGGDGTAALELPETPHVEAQLGKTLNGTPTPSAASLVQVTRARNHSLLPTGVRDVLDDRYVDGEHAQIGFGHANEAAYRAAVIAELQGARATAALARKDARLAQQGLEAAMGIGRSR